MRIGTIRQDVRYVYFHLTRFVFVLLDCRSSSCCNEFSFRTSSGVPKAAGIKFIRYIIQLAYFPGGKIMATEKDKKKVKKAAVKKGRKPLGEPVDVKGIAGGDDCCSSMASDPKSVSKLKF